MAANPQIQNVLSLEIDAVRRLYDVVFELKAIRARIELLGVPSLTSEQFAEHATGDLDHLTRTRVRQLFAAMDALDATFVTPTTLDGVTNVPPVAAVVACLR